MPRLSLVHPVLLAKQPPELATESPYFPLGILYLAGYVREAGHEVSIFDGTFETDESSFDAYLDEYQPDLVGISAVVTTRDAALRFAARAAERGAVVVLGGPDPTASPAAYLSDPNVDIVVHHEGEQTIARLLELAGNGPLTTEVVIDEPGIALRIDGQIKVSQPRPPIENLDELPAPARDLIDMDRYLHHWDENSGYTSITVATGRGCPFGCEWCRDAVHGDGFRQRSPESVAAEIKALKDAYGPESIRIIDDVDGLDEEWVESWATAVKELDAAIPFEPLQSSARSNLPLLVVRDSL